MGFCGVLVGLVEDLVVASSPVVGIKRSFHNKKIRVSRLRVDLGPDQMIW